MSDSSAKFAAILISDKQLSNLAHHLLDLIMIQFPSKTKGLRQIVANTD